jgi:UDP-N-acetyl-2-amino-2-deoxyglucuronate dehydrogenase
MARPKLNFGIIGLGAIADKHAPAIHALRGGQLHSCYSRSAKKAKAFSGTHGAEPYSDLKAFLADPELDVVTICTPSGAHLEPGLAAARAGKHVIMEKPLEVTPARCTRLIRTCAAKRVKLVTIFPSRFKEANVLMKDALKRGRLGKPVSASCHIRWFRPQSYYDSGAWRGTWDLDGGGCLMNQGIHNVDLFIWLMGDVSEVSAYMDRPTRKRIEVETNLVASLKFKSGALGTIVASTEIYPGYPKSLEISGTKGSVASVEEDLVTWDFINARPEDRRILRKFATRSNASGGSSDPMAISYEGHRLQFQELADVVQGRKRKITCDGNEGLRSVKLICAIYKSAQTGKPVKLR